MAAAWQAELAAARAAAAAAAAVAVRMQTGIASRPKADGSPVTDADLAADAAIRAILLAAFPQDVLLSEEAVDDPARLAASRVWIIDPIDGTRDFAAGGAGWAVQVALVVDSRLVLGVLDMPALGCSLWGVVGGAAGIADAAGERVLRPAGGGRDVLVASQSRRNRESLAQIRAALPEFACITSTSVGVKVRSLLAGEASLYPHARDIHEWDAAAPAAVLIAAGGHATALSGAELAWNTPSGCCPGLLFSLRDDHPDLARRLTAAGLAVG